MNKRLKKKNRKKALNRMKNAKSHIPGLENMTVGEVAENHMLKIFLEKLGSQYEGPYYTRNIKRAFKSFKKEYDKRKFLSYKHLRFAKHLTHNGENEDDVRFYVRRVL